MEEFKKSTGGNRKEKTTKMSTLSSSVKGPILKKSLNEKNVQKTALKNSKSTKSVEPAKPDLRTAPNVKKSLNKANESERMTSVNRAKTTRHKTESVVKKLNPPTLIKKNTKPNTVLDNIHNVTVSSPPMTRKSAPESESEIIESQLSSKRTRTNTRTLQPEEIVVLRNESAKHRIEAEIKSTENTTSPSPVKDSVAFEINFGPEVKTRTQANYSTKSESNIPSDPDANYSDDFESYESDFESGSHSSSSFSDEGSIDNVEAQDENLSNAPNWDEEPDDDESEPTQNPITVIQRDKFMERNFDSGNYDMNSRIQENMNDISSTTQQQTFDSLDTYSGTASEQLDSGISSCPVLPQLIERKNEKCITSFGGCFRFYERPIINVRGVELMSKIKFDTLTFTLLDLKPISYDTFMQSYGKLNTTQSFTQSNENFATSDTQTDDCDMLSKWTQHPPKYDRDSIHRPKIFISSEVYSDISFEDTDIGKLLGRKQAANHFLTKSTDFNKLQSFIASSSKLVSKVLNRTYKSPTERGQHLLADYSETGISIGLNQLNTKFLNALRVTHVFANSRHNSIVTVLESIPEADVYRCDFSNLLMVWSTNDCNKPTRLLSTWSKVCRVEICNDMQDIIVGGLRDGSVAMWDLRETYSYCSKLDGHLTHFAATQSIAPIWKDNIKIGEWSDLGAIIDIRSFLPRRKFENLTHPSHSYKTIQFVSLNDSGVIVVWTLVEIPKSDNAFEASNQTNNKNKVNSFDKRNTRIEYSSPWARVKLVQSAICDLRSYLERDILTPPSKFDKAKLLFEKNIYSDEILREINKNTMMNGNCQLQGLRFASLAVGCDSIYVCTNRNFILICYKSLKANKFRKVFIDESRFLFPTALKLLPNEDFLAVGLSNGSVMILNCTQRNILRKFKPSNGILKSQGILSTPETQKYSENDLETGKSCAIQNIILNERSSFDQCNNQNNAMLYQTLNTAADVQPSIQKPKPFEMRILDQETLLSGCMLRKHLVQSLELSSNGRHLFALSDGEIRGYDFYLDKELTFDELASLQNKNSAIVSIASAQSSMMQQHLILLTNENVVKMHLLKQ